MKDKNVRDIMTRGVISVQEEDSVREVAGTLIRNKIHAVAVTALGGKVTGVISEIDVIGHIDEDMDMLKAKHIMSSHVKSIIPETTLADAAKIMHGRHWHRLLVMGEPPHKEVAIGIIAASDIVAEIAKMKG